MVWVEPVLEPRSPPSVLQLMLSSHRQQKIQIVLTKMLVTRKVQLKILNPMNLPEEQLHVRITYFKFIFYLYIFQCLKVCYALYFFRFSCWFTWDVVSNCTKNFSLPFKIISMFRCKYIYFLCLNNITSRVLGLFVVMHVFFSENYISRIVSRSTDYVYSVFNLC